MIVAQIENSVVVNVLEVLEENLHEFPDCVPIGDIYVGIGDTYADGKFYRNGEEIINYEVLAKKSIALVNTLEEQVRRDQLKIKALTDELAITNDVLQDLILSTMGG